MVVICTAGERVYLIEFGVESLFLHGSLVLGFLPHIWLQGAEGKRNKLSSSNVTS